MSIRRIPPGDKRILKPLEEAWQSPDDQDVTAEAIIKWLRLNIHRQDVGLWVVIEKGKIMGAMIAFGPSLINTSAHIYTAWLAKGAKINSRDFFSGDFEDWVRSMGAQDITINSASHSGRAWERRFGFKGYSRVYIKRLEAVEGITEWAGTTYSQSLA